SVQKARWGRFNVIQGKVKVELPKTYDVDGITLDKAKELIEAAKPKKRKAPAKKKTAKKKTTKK
ncbi:MAG: topoisomerase C-terminal repeat-containing protein, partial [Saprospiraceae bacterium]